MCRKAYKIFSLQIGKPDSAVEQDSKTGIFRLEVTSCTTKSVRLAGEKALYEFLAGRSEYANYV
jgi:hypothetical protein